MGIGWRRVTGTPDLVCGVCMWCVGVCVSVACMCQGTQRVPILTTESEDM